MEGVSTNVYKGLKGYWKRRGYEKLNGTGRRTKNRVECAGGSSPKKRSWRIKLTPRVKLKLRFSPKRLLVGIRDAYINFMNRLASSNIMISGGVGGGYGGAYGGGGGGGKFGARPLKEYDEKMIIEIYKSLVIGQGQIVPHRDVGKIGNQLICQRGRISLVAGGRTRLIVSIEKITSDENCSDHCHYFTLIALLLSPHLDTQIFWPRLLIKVSKIARRWLGG